ncbi:cytochrome C assembly protein [Slackia equolifaciens]|uniref:Cytochrome C assembly protein n=1 Tax=Slackia equolifaciens TaxID=498718 RepID=A0A3N0AY40_9ACTN|nr:cytochrome c biogenesis protein CcsA [Slackia equolifaciens]RNL39520.1 cytochrome C assembly protein [Slackia equolifaciens]
MSTFGLIGLVVAFAGVAVSIVCLLAGQILRRTGRADTAETLSWGGCVASLLSFLALTVCCGILVYCFLTGDMSIEYVLENHSSAEGVLGTLYRFSGLWAGREGSLLFWAWLISVFNAVVAVRAMRKNDAMDYMALFVSQLVLAAFVGVLLFSEDNMPFITTPDYYFGSDGQLTAEASVLGMNSLLEHWAQAIHPPTLFIGYAGLTIPFAYAIAALIVNDASAKWVRRSSRFAMFSWLFLGIGIGLGSVWAYVVLGWGGYWGWDPVENASLLSWMVALALVHSLTVYRQRGAFKRWSIMCACLAFTFAVVGTFITRSGIVQSVHAFAGDPVSLYLFGTLIVASVLMGIVGLVIRWKSFGQGDAIESLASKDAAYYFNNVIMIVFTLLLLYLTVSSALPSFLPFGGQSLSAGTYNAVARPLGIVYCFIIAVCPLLAWGKTGRRAFFKQAKIPAIFALVLFIVLMVYFVTTLYPAYEATLAAGDSNAQGLANEGPVWYYNGLAVVGFAVASLLFFNTLFMIGRAVRARSKNTGKNPVASFFTLLVKNSSRFGGYIAHLAMAIILVGLIGSSMYVTETVQYVNFDEEANTADSFTVDDYELRYTDSSVEEINNGEDYLYTVQFDVYDVNSGAYLGHVAPSVQLDAMTQQTKLNASVLGSPLEDLFVVYRGVSEDGQLSMDVRVNPLISFTWVGFGLLMVGTAIALLGRRKDAVDASAKSAPADNKPAGEDVEPAVSKE